MDNHSLRGFYMAQTFISGGLCFKILYFKQYYRLFFCEIRLEDTSATAILLPLELKVAEHRPRSVESCQTQPDNAIFQLLDDNNFYISLYAWMSIDDNFLVTTDEVCYLNKAD